MFVLQRVFNLKGIETAIKCFILYSDRLNLGGKTFVLQNYFIIKGIFYLFETHLFSDNTDVDDCYYFFFNFKFILIIAIVFEVGT